MTRWQWITTSLAVAGAAYLIQHAVFNAWLASGPTPTNESPLQEVYLRRANISLVLGLLLAGYAGTVFWLGWFRGTTRLAHWWKSRIHGRDSLGSPELPAFRIATNSTLWILIAVASSILVLILL